VANLTASRVSAVKVRKLGLFAPTLSVSVDMQAQEVLALRVENTGDRRQIRPFEIAVERAEPLVCEQADFVRAVRRRTAPLVSGEEGRDALVLAHRVLGAIEEYRRAAEGVIA
jgi:predicted dehydrogenase